MGIGALEEGLLGGDQGHTDATHGPLREQGAVPISGRRHGSGQSVWPTWLRVLALPLGLALNSPSLIELRGRYLYGDWPVPP